jgi:hypothetical protein
MQLFDDDDDDDNNNNGKISEVMKLSLRGQRTAVCLASRYLTQIIFNSFDIRIL